MGRRSHYHVEPPPPSTTRRNSSPDDKWVYKGHADLLDIEVAVGSALEDDRMYSMMWKVYRHLNDTFDIFFENEKLARTIHFALRDERLFLNIDDSEDELNWVQGSSLAFDRHNRNGGLSRMSGSSSERILEVAEALKNTIHSSLNQRSWRESGQASTAEGGENMHRCRAHPGPLFAHRVFLAGNKICEL